MILLLCYNIYKYILNYALTEPIDEVYVISRQLKDTFTNV